MSSFQTSAAAGRPLTVAFADRGTIAEKLSTLSETGMDFLKAAMENPQADESLLGGVELYLD